MKRARHAFLTRIGMRQISSYISIPLIFLGELNYTNGIVELHDDIVSRQVCRSF